MVKKTKDDLFIFADNFTGEKIQFKPKPG